MTSSQIVVLLSQNRHLKHPPCFALATILLTRAIGQDRSLFTSFCPIFVILDEFKILGEFRKRIYPHLSWRFHWQWCNRMVTVLPVVCSLTYSKFQSFVSAYLLSYHIYHLFDILFHHLAVRLVISSGYVVCYISFSGEKRFDMNFETKIISLCGLAGLLLNKSKSMHWCNHAHSLVMRCFTLAI